MKRIFRPTMLFRPIFTLLCSVLLAPLPALAIDTERDDVQQFIAELVSKEGFDKSYVESMMSTSEVQESILEAMRKPAEKVMPWHKYRAIFMTPERIDAGVKFRAEHRESLRRIASETGVSEAMILGIVGVESYFGRITGKHRVLDALTTLGFDYPPRAKFFRSELSQAFLLAREENIDLDGLMGSYAGAMGPPQFIPSSYRAYAVDGDGDGKRDLINSWDDVLASVANYFVAHKWQTGQPVAAQATVSADNKQLPLNDGLVPESTVGALSDAGVYFPAELGRDAKAGVWQLDGKDGNEYWVGFDNLYVITRYNRSIMYALAAWSLGEAIVSEPTS